ncbi:unnamed protein product [Litomosoides sigmodontis]|uniref:Uncharacterized protein n=1 Tax=Litomosoides sigmodontis TaxID=42156 RepID=A0A3P6UCR0_LITSI|nr:unnamed protein product [Litomosoides sigmodontis]
MLGYGVGTSASTSRHHQYSREIVEQQDSMLHNSYNIEDVDDYDHPEISQNGLRSKSPTTIGQYDVPPSESDHESLHHHRHREADYYDVRESDGHLSIPSGQLPNGSITPFNNAKYDRSKQYSPAMKDFHHEREVESDFDESEYSFERKDSGRTQSKALRVQFTVEEDSG